MSRIDRQKPVPISVCILTKNNENTIGLCLAPLARFDEVIVLDTGSTDRTLEIVATFPNVRVFHRDGIDNFGIVRNELTSYARNDWVFHIDSDEILDTRLVELLADSSLDPNTVYALRIRFFYQRKPLPPFDFWKNDLYHRKTTAWQARTVHESLEIRPGIKTKKLPFGVDHYSYDSLDHLMQKARLYGTLFADQFVGQRRATPYFAVLRSGFAFLRYYIFRGSILYGYDGLTVTCCFSFGTFLKYVELFERNRELENKKREQESNPR